MKYSITVIPHALGTPDGFLFKTSKSKVVTYLISKLVHLELPPDKETLFIEDGNAKMRSLTDIPQTFKHISFKVLDSLQNKTNVVFSTDMYLPGSIKSHELLQRVCSEKLILEGVNQRKPADFKVFLQNNENKQQLF